MTAETQIMAIVTEGKERVGGSVPIFFAEGGKEKEDLAFLLEKILDGMAHQLDDRTTIIVRHG
ncbi:capping complex subunit for YIEGIA [Salinithrix halophila]|uniref:Uncharacterized protein n=1 Tax=Salinithrix halophila TaxID=1485204 RepID=A0ABV8JGK2_9BACL